MRFGLSRSAVLFYGVFLSCLAADAVDDIVINEIYYHAPDTETAEFVELYNPTAAAIDISGYTFVAGIFYTIPAGTTIPAGGYLLVVSDPTHRKWSTLRNLVWGPYNGGLSNRGELILLRAPDGRTIEEFTYHESHPWPKGADGYGASLERISPDIASDDYHAWRASLSSGGTPGQRNSVADIPPYPTIVESHISPALPRSTDRVTFDLVFDDSGLINQVELRVERLTTTGRIGFETIPMTLVRREELNSTYRASIPAQNSQTLVRFGAKATLTDGRSVVLPHAAEPCPFLSYFVYNEEISSLLPIFWIFRERVTEIQTGSVRAAGVVVKPVTESIRVFDGAKFETSRNGHKIRFLKGEEYRGDRTVNLIPESPVEGTSSGPQAPFVEHLSLQLFREFGILTPRCDWIRVIDQGVQTQ
ncbi:MAG: lamin tail domain-containing protein [Candidatus Omnitrophota bacterium]|jgi:hypothetical protein|nr:MAG: lamin tail domain-containing protein [Candidatus Omnitrophota bacterium]